MPRAATVFLSIAAVCLFLGLAWTNLFWETPYRPVLEALSLSRLPESHFARGVGVFFLLCGLITIIWRPAWLSIAVLILCLIPVGFFTAGNVMLAAGERDQIAILASSAVLIGTPLILLFAGRFRLRRFGVFLTRLTLTLSFATLALLAIGKTWPVEIPNFGKFLVGLPRPESWNAALANPLLPELSESHQQLLWWCLAGAAAFGILGSWIKMFTPPAALTLCILSLAGITLVVIANVDFGKPIASQLHRWAPVAVLHLPLAILPIALWQMVWPGKSARRKLKRVEAVPPDAERALPPKKVAKPKDGADPPRRKLKRVDSPPADDAEPEDSDDKPRKKLKRIT